MKKKPIRKRQEVVFLGGAVRVCHDYVIGKRRIEFDEVWARGCFVHVERMNDGHIWIGFTRGKRTVHLNLHSRAFIDAGPAEE